MSSNGLGRVFAAELTLTVVELAEEEYLADAHIHAGGQIDPGRNEGTARHRAGVVIRVRGVAVVHPAVRAALINLSEGRYGPGLPHRRGRQLPQRLGIQRIGDVQSDIVIQSAADRAALARALAADQDGLPGSIDVGVGDDRRPVDEGTVQLAPPFVDQVVLLSVTAQIVEASSA